jgi:DNA-binding GntR family transcriptional regulator
LSAINEQTLMEDLDLGRTPIREALQRLAAENLVFFAPRRGIFVADVSITDLYKIFELRLVLEAFCAGLAAERATPAQLVQLDAVVQELHRVAPGDGKTLMAMDERFHELLYQAADNDFLAECLRPLHALSLRMWHLVLNRLGDVRGAMEQHVEIAEAIKEGDGTRASALLRQHIVEFQQGIKAVI